MIKPFLGMLLVLSISASAQHQIRAAYFGETITHYGFKVAYDHPFSQREKKKSDESIILKQWLLGGGVSFFRHPHQQKGVILSPEVTWRRTGKRGGLLDVAFSPAFFRYFYEGTTFEYTGDGFKKIPLAGGNACLPTLSVGGGRDLSVKRGIPLMWYYRVNVMRQYPYNASSLMRFALESGIIYKI